MAEHAAALREQAAARAGDEITVATAAVQGGCDGARMEPRDRLDGYLARGDALGGEPLAVLVSQMEPLPKEEPWRRRAASTACQA